MPTLSSVSCGPRSIPSTVWADGETQLLRAVLAKEPIITLTGEAGSGKTRLLDRMMPLLAQSSVRTIRISNPTDAGFDRRRLLKQVIDAAPDDEITDPAKRLFAALIRPHNGESQVALIIDDAHTLMHDAFDCLGLVVSVAQAGPIPLQVVLVGRPEMWERFPQQRFLAVEGIATQLVLCRRKAAVAAADLRLLEGLFGPSSWPLLPEIAAPRDTLPALPTRLFPVSRGEGVAEQVSEAPPPVVPRQWQGGLAWIPLSVGFLMAAGSAAFVYFAPAERGPHSTRSPVQLDHMISAPFDFAPPQGGSKKAAAVTMPASLAMAGLSSISLPPAIVSLLKHGDQLLATGDIAAAMQVYVLASEIAQDLAAPEALAGAELEAAAPIAPEAIGPAMPEAAGAATSEMADQATPESAQMDLMQAVVPLPAPSPEPAADLREAVMEPPAPTMPSPSLEIPGAATPEFASPATPEPAQTDPAQALAPLPTPASEAAPDLREAVMDPPAPTMPSPSPEIPGAAKPEFASPATPEPAQTNPAQALAPQSVPPSVAASEPREAVREAPAQVTPIPPATAQPSRDAAAAPALPAIALAIPKPPVPVTALVQILLARGDALLATGDVVAARLMYERAAVGGSSRAAIAAGMTHDPGFLAQLGVRGILPDPHAASDWYRRAADLGDVAAAGLLARLGPAGR